jgi:hypothetical protein
MLSGKGTLPKREFDVFAKLNKDGWKFFCTLEAHSVDDAKNLALVENPQLQPHKLAVYPRR